MKTYQGKGAYGAIAIGIATKYKRENAFSPCLILSDQVYELQRLEAAENARKNGIWIGICGELASDPTLTESFLRMGITELSVSPAMVLPLRGIVRSIN